MLLSWAYARAEAQHLAPVEYSAFVWACLFGLAFFHEPVRPLTLVGAAMIVGACLVAARSGGPVADIEAAISVRAAEHVDGEGEHADIVDEAGEAVEHDDFAHPAAGEVAVRRLERHSEREREIDEIAVIRLGRSGKSMPPLSLPSSPSR